MSFWKSVFALTLVGILVWWWYPTEESRPGPDDRLASYVHGMCHIMDDHQDNPHAGVDALFGYFGQHAPDMMKQVGELLVAIERIPDDKAHDRRARQAHRRVGHEFQRCESTAAEFFEAVEDDPEALERLAWGLERFNRTLELLLGGADMPANASDLQRRWRQMADG